jgi:hypothetical protein
MKPVIQWDEEKDGRRGGTVAVMRPWDIDAIREDVRLFLGRVNRTPVLFENAVCLSETMVFATVSINLFRNCDGVFVAEVAYRFIQATTRGICEDGQIRFVGWNRGWRPVSERWDRLEPNPFPFAEEAHPDGFASLWKGNVDEPRRAG